MAALFLACDEADYDAATATCAAPYYGNPPALFPALDAADGALIAGAIVGTWSLGLVARLLIRSAQQETNRY